MAISIIKPPESMFVMRCLRCDCVFSYEKDDLSEDKAFKGSNFSLRVYCPSCKTSNSHNLRKTKKGDKKLWLK